MTSYGELYPQCATCPRIIAWQESRDAMTHAFEVAKINDNLDKIATDHAVDQTRAAIDARYADHLDDVQDGLVSDEVHREAKDVYEGLDEKLKSAEDQGKRRSDLADTAMDFVTMIGDREVERLAGDCRGTLELSLCGLHKTICRSRGKHSAIRPPQPYGTE